jgi:hypothetical protein
LKLVRTGSAAKDTRQRQPKSKLLEIAADNQVDREAVSKVLDKLVDGRLLVSDREGEDWIDLAHEALMDGWEQLAAWCQEDRELRRLIDQIEDALREWQKSPHNENLMMGGLLAKVRLRLPQLEPNLPLPAREFYHLSDEYEQERTDALRQVIATSLNGQATRVQDLLRVKPLEGFVLAIQLVGESLEELGNVFDAVENCLHRAAQRVGLAWEYDTFRGHEG